MKKLLSLWIAYLFVLGLQAGNGKWKARFFSAGGNTFLFLKDKKDTKTLGKVKEILKNLPADKKKYVRIISDKEAKKIGANPGTPIILSGLEGASFGNDYKGKDLQAGGGGNHGYYPDSREIQTGFLCVAKNVRAHYEIKEMNERDTPAIILKYLDLKMPTCEGKVPAGLFIKQ